MRRPQSTYCGRSRPRRWTPQPGGEPTLQGSHSEQPESAGDRAFGVTRHRLISARSSPSKSDETRKHLDFGHGAQNRYYPIRRAVTVKFGITPKAKAKLERRLLLGNQSAATTQSAEPRDEFPAVAKRSRPAWVISCCIQGLVFAYRCPRTPFSGSGADWRTAVRTAVCRNARRRSAAVSAYGEGRRDVAAKRDPPRRFVRDNIGALIDPIGRFEYIALYDMNFTTTARRAAFLKRVTRVFKAW